MAIQNKSFAIWYAENRILKFWRTREDQAYVYSLDSLNDAKEFVREHGISQGFVVEEFCR